jgi:hypothetical protein
MQRSRSDQVEGRQKLEDSVGLGKFRKKRPNPVLGAFAKFWDLSLNHPLIESRLETSQIIIPLRFGEYILVL